MNTLLTPGKVYQVVFRLGNLKEYHELKFRGFTETGQAAVFWHPQPFESKVAVSCKWEKNPDAPKVKKDRENRIGDDAIMTYTYADKTVTTLSIPCKNILDAVLL